MSKDMGMWKYHLIINGILIALALPLYFVDVNLLKPNHGGFISLDFRGVIFRSYVIILALHLVITTAWLYFGTPPSLTRIHLTSFVASTGLFIAGFFATVTFYEASTSAEREARLENRKNLYDVIKLEKWWYVPSIEHPKEIHVQMTFSQNGRFAAQVDGWEKGDYGEQIYVGELDNQIQVKAGDTVTAVLNITHYNSGEVEKIRFFFYLFEKKKGPSEGDISKAYLDTPTTKDNGKYFYEHLPAPSQ